MAAAVGNGKQTPCLCFSFIVLYLTLFQVHLMVCLHQGSPLSRVLRSLSLPHFETVESIQLYKPVYSPKVPFLGTLSEPLSIGKVIRVFGYIPEGTRRFFINFCSNCTEGPLHLHFDVRFYVTDVVRNNYENGRWKNEERGSLSGTFPFEEQTEFFLEFEVTEEAYFISLNGNLLWKFDHRVPYSSADLLEIQEGPILIWKIEYTDKTHQEENDIFPIADLSGKNMYQVGGTFGTGLALHVAGSPTDVVEKFTMNLRCECTPQNSTSIGSEFGDKK